MDSIEDMVRATTDQVILQTPDRQPSRLKTWVQDFVASLEDSELSSYLMWCNSRGIRAVLEQESSERCALALADLCGKKEYTTITTNAFLMLDDEKRIAILNNCLEQAGEYRPLYKNLIDRITAFSENKIREWNPERNLQDDEFAIPDQYVYIGAWPEGFSASAKKCVFCDNDYKKWQLLYGADCGKHTFHETCEMKDDRDKGIVESVCSSCNGGGYQSRNELESEVRDRLLREQRQSSQP